MTACYAAFSRGGPFPSLASIDESLHGREMSAALSRSSLSSRPQPFSPVALVYFQIGVAVRMWRPLVDSNLERAFLRVTCLMDGCFDVRTQELKNLIL
jgi:hypothetical protein